MPSDPSGLNTKLAKAINEKVEVHMPDSLLPSDPSGLNTKLAKAINEKVEVHMPDSLLPSDPSGLNTKLAKAINEKVEVHMPDSLLPSDPSGLNTKLAKAINEKVEVHMPDSLLPSDPSGLNTKLAKEIYKKLSELSHNYASAIVDGDDREIEEKKHALSNFVSEINKLLKKYGIEGYDRVILLKVLLRSGDDTARFILRCLSSSKRLLENGDPINARLFLRLWNTNSEPRTSHSYFQHHLENNAILPPSAQIQALTLEWLEDRFHKVVKRAINKIRLNFYESLPFLEMIARIKTQKGVRLPPELQHMVSELLFPFGKELNSELDKLKATHPEQIEVICAYEQSESYSEVICKLRDETYRLLTVVADRNSRATKGLLLAYLGNNRSTTRFKLNDGVIGPRTAEMMYTPNKPRAKPI